MSVFYGVRLTDEMDAKVQATGKGKSAVVQEALEAYFGGNHEKPEKMIIERAKHEKKPRAKPIERENPIEPEKPIERAKQAVYGDWNQAPIYQKPAHAETCSCYSCKPPK